MKEDGTFVVESGGGELEGRFGVGSSGADGVKLPLATDLRRQLAAQREETRLLKEKLARLKSDDSTMKVRPPPPR